MRLAAILAVCLSACASNPGVAPIGPDTYIVSRQAATGSSGLGSLKEDTLREANDYCVTQKKSMVVISTTYSKPPYVLGNYARSEVKFRCIAPGEAAKPEPPAK
jgi:hypothetical protein